MKKVIFLCLIITTTFASLGKGVKSVGGSFSYTEEHDAPDETEKRLSISPYFGYFVTNHFLLEFGLTIFKEKEFDRYCDSSNHIVNCYEQEKEEESESLNIGFRYIFNNNIYLGGEFIKGINNQISSNLGALVSTHHFELEDEDFRCFKVGLLTPVASNVYINTSMNKIFSSDSKNDDEYFSISAGLQYFW